ncbi:MAG: hypothetical protein A2722_03970 [Candidatus Doudnabacteria bacterium RIFCSPHIGHO2_01_FULL_50_11]|uniref:Nudix hydrolase domain-containing protein n=1 Tax=Candidatus Doudnabacteria bacterium RIFCSPHIGHO2_01_FULL_50_11 TaxID=1817828 RepID=A0A1F5PMJ5_9BACT|nr:MAG: hypothetical protein A2722_03970 [Candidatus Doudnabacteria bacterium RIFCSPHIGHO2_01_FULL_50_11]
MEQREIHNYSHMQDEVYDVVNEKGEKVATATWHEVHAKGLLHATAAALVFKDASKKEILIKRRSNSMIQKPGLWEYSAGGHVLAGQTPEGGVRAELQEELFEGRKLPKFVIRPVMKFFNNDIPNNKEILHLFEAIYPGPFFHGRKEVAAPPKWVKWLDLLADMRNKPEKYTPVFHNIIEHYQRSQASG